ncbi:MAG: ROK family transcriptional regulator [Promicromonosporaceae bacterium]|nr:ROK family transcriptional regulator [Promicromonosporaceae bacterium]
MIVSDKSEVNARVSAGNGILALAPVTNGGGIESTPMRILDLLRAEQPLSRVELANRLGVTQATVTNVVKLLLEGGLVHEGMRAQLSRGAPRRLLELVPDAWYAIGVQIDSTTMTVVISDYAGNRVAATSLRGPGDLSPEAAIAELVDHIEDLLESTAIPRHRILGVGLVTYGPQDRPRGMLLTPQPTPEWYEFPLTSRLGEALGLPVLLENDATAAAIGEQALGVVPSASFGVLFLSTGVGGAVVIDGAPYRGRSSNAVELDHVIIRPGGRECLCGARGCVGVEAQPMTVSALGFADPEIAARLDLRGSPEECLADFERLARAARGADSVAADLLEKSADDLGLAAVTMFNLFDIDTLVLTGPAFRTAGPLYQQRIEAILRRYSANRDLTEPRVLVSANPELDAPMGGALQVLRTVSPPLERSAALAA